MATWQYPQLEGHPRRIRHEGGELRGQLDQPVPARDLLPDRVAEEAAPLVGVVLTGLRQLRAEVVEDDGSRQDPRVGVPDPGARLVVTTSHDHVSDLHVAL